MNYQSIHAVSVKRVYSDLDTSDQGLSQAQAAQRLQQFGPNLIHKVSGKPLYQKLIANFTHLMALLLWVGGLVAFIANMPELGIAVWTVIFINGFFSFWQEYRAEKAIEALRQLVPQYVHVLRGGEDQKILAEELVPGDVMIFSEGDRISADARIVQEAGLFIDQSTLTGESQPVPKTNTAVTKQGLAHIELPNLVFAGTNVVSGTGRAVVFATAMESEFGKIAGLTQSLGEESSPLQKELTVITRIITIFAIAIGGFFFLLAVFFVHINLSESFIFALGMIVAFVPEGLLPTVTLALAMGTQRMAKHNALIKKLSSVETLGCTTVICSDKTGTLTKNEMTVDNLWLPPLHATDKKGRQFTVTGVGYVPEGKIFHDKHEYSAENDKGLLELLRAAVLCNNARLIEPNDQITQWSILGDPTEAALLVAAQKAGFDFKNEKKHNQIIYELPFESYRKRMTTIHQGNVAYVKGAPLETLDLCNSIERAGVIQSLSTDLRRQIIQANDDFASKGLRVLAIAKRQLPITLTDYSTKTVEQDLVFLGLIAMMDPPRPEVIPAIAQCHTAGIRTVMITGDYGLTAESIARNIGMIQNDKFRIVTGNDLDSVDDAKLAEIVQEEVIFARVAPGHKLRVVSALQALGNVVAVTGDGVNDAPALKKADIGVAMGIEGTDVAKEASDMILTDDNFASIVSAIQEGRAVYSNIKKFTTYIFTSNTPEAIPFILFVLSRTRIPLALGVMQILAIDLGTDMMPALALGAEAPEPDIMNRPPRNLKEHVVTPSLLIRAYPFLGLIQATAAMSAFYFMYWRNGYFGHWLDLPSSGILYQAASSMALGAVIATQIGNLFAQRTERISSFRMGLFSNRMIFVGIATELILVTTIIYVPFFQRIFGTASFPPAYWLFLFAWTPSLLLADELRKWVLRMKQ